MDERNAMVDFVRELTSYVGTEAEIRAEGTRPFKAKIERGDSCYEAAGKRFTLYLTRGSHIEVVTQDGKKIDLRKIEV
jgi:hypothetical protein